MTNFSAVAEHSAQMKCGMGKADGGVDEHGGANGELLPRSAQIVG